MGKHAIGIWFLGKSATEDDHRDHLVADANRMRLDGEELQKTPDCWMIGLSLRRDSGG